MQVKLGVSVILAFLVFLFVTQNTELVEVEFLFWTREISLALLVFIMLGSGVVLGWLLNSYLRFIRQRKPAQTEVSMSQRSNHGPQTEADKEPMGTNEEQKKREST